MSADLSSIPIPDAQLHAFRNLTSAKRFAIDIGGSLAKLAYYSEVRRKRTRTFPGSGEPREVYEVEEVDSPIAKLDFIKFETKYIETCLDFIQSRLLPTNNSPTKNQSKISTSVLKATGGGAHKYTKLLAEKLGLRVDKEDEMACLIKGCNFLLKHLPNESFIWQRDASHHYQFQSLEPDIFPYLLVNIGSGVSILKVESEDSYRRIGGTSMGGGTFWGLGSLLTKAKGFDELLDLAESGEHKNVDMLVSDIYGGPYEQMNLAADLTASSFGKAARASKESIDTAERFDDADKAKSLLHLISNDIGQIAYLNARLHNLDRIYFGGFFIRGHPVTMRTISFGINYWSKGEIKALFLRHEGYLGAVGAFLKGAEEEEIDLGSWTENLASSSGFYDQPVARAPSPVPYGVLELDRMELTLVPLPLIKCSYMPDLINLSEDKGARQHWIQRFMEALSHVADLAIACQLSSDDVYARAQQFVDEHKKQLARLTEEPNAFGTLTVGSLFDARQQCLAECSFPDPFVRIKRANTELAITKIPDVFRQLDAMELKQRHLCAIENLLAGNACDARGSDLFGDEPLTFEEAKTKIQRRPWLVDSFDDWLRRMESDAPAHACALIFVDNSGIDIAVGVLAFARELLRKGTKVILSPISFPSVNNVTASELEALLLRVKNQCSIIESADRSGQLLVMESGTLSPCLDLRRIDSRLAEACKQHGVDLVVLEGMGRAVYTNFDVQFNCESLKLAVLKNRWLAERLGGKQYDVVFKYEK
ncbi:4'-phosphopantetheine phosphatase-like [Oscarella lobularis]|uniref:4'-phosphopantetheine phosphatase-like n=1 Tax=Oscarella lobularis TaxID=121494 RepID=UPI003313C0B8